MRSVVVVAALSAILAAAPVYAQAADQAKPAAAAPAAQAPAQPPAPKPFPQGAKVAYVVLQRLYITPFGNRLPNLTFEVET